ISDKVRSSERRVTGFGKDRCWPKAGRDEGRGAAGVDARNRNSVASADETGSFGAAASATQTEQNQSRAQHRQADDAQNEKVRMLIVKRVRMGRPGLVGSSGRQQSEPAGETEERFHALMLCADAEKSSLGFNTLCGENLAVHSAQTPGVCGIFPLREPGGVRPNFYPLEIRARRSLAPLFMVPMRDSGIVEATHASVGMSCIFVSLTPASPLGRGRIVRCLSAVPGVAYPRDSSLMLANLLQARRRVDGRRQRDCRRLWP